MRVWPLLLLTVVACSRKNPHGDKPVADTWEDPEAPGAGDGTGLAPPETAPDHGGGLPPGHPDIGGGGGDPGGGGGGDMQAMAPDPDRPIDMSKFLRGAVTVAPAVKDKVPTTGVMFLSVRTPGPDGKPMPGSIPIAVDVIDPLPAFPYAFDLHEGKAMINGTTFVGDVVIVARIDQDGDADSRQPGDLVGRVLATIPADKLTLTLDTIGP